MNLGFEIQKTNVGIRISIFQTPCVPIFRQNEQLWLFWPKFTQKWILGPEFQNLSPNLESAPPRYVMCQFSVKMYSFQFSGLNLGKLSKYVQYFGSNNVERTGWKLKWAGWSWMELGEGWNELGGGGWSWVEVGAWFSNTQNKTFSETRNICPVRNQCELVHTKWTYHWGRRFASNFFIFLKILFPNAHFHTFRKCWSFNNLGYFFPTSIRNFTIMLMTRRKSRN